MNVLDNTKSQNFKVMGQQTTSISKTYPVFYLSYVNERITKKGTLKLPPAFLKSVARTSKMGFTIHETKLSNDHVVIASKNNYKKKIQEYIDTKNPKLAKGAIILWAQHAPYRHFRDFIFPAMKKLLETDSTINGVFLAEADLYLYDGYDFDWFMKTYGKSNINVWLAWKKKLSNYIVGNFFLYFSRESFKLLEKFILTKKSKNMLSDRFFYQLWVLGDIKLNEPKPIGNELEHFSAVAGGIRK